jgi:hypothetical protein
MDVAVQMMSLRENTFFVPVSLPAAAVRSALQTAPHA